MNHFSQWRTAVFPATHAITISGSGDATILAAPGAGKRIVCNSYVVVIDSAAGVKFKSGSTDKTGAMPFPENGGASSVSRIICGVNESLVVNLDAAANGGGHCEIEIQEAVD